METLERAPAIPKEAIPTLHFDDHDALQTKADRRARERMLYFAMILGNNYKCKVRITFESLEGLREVETTVWMSGEDNVMLKGGVMLPVSAIKSVEF